MNYEAVNHRNHCYGLCLVHDRGSNVEIDVECQIFVIVIFLTAAEFYNWGHIQGIIRVH